MALAMEPSQLSAMLSSSGSSSPGEGKTTVIKEAEPGQEKLATASLHRFPHGSDGTESAGNAGDPGLIPGSGSSPGEGNGNPR